MIKKNKYGMNGYHSTKNFQAGDLIARFKGKVVSKPSRSTLQIGENQHIEVDGDEVFFNHSCTPNAKIMGVKIVALGAIEKGEEICFDYNTTEDVLADPFKCSCCGKFIRGKKYESGKVGVEEKEKISEPEIK